jgi:hypothetical protein
MLCVLCVCVWLAYLCLHLYYLSLMFPSNSFIRVLDLQIKSSLPQRRAACVLENGGTNEPGTIIHHISHGQEVG